MKYISVIAVLLSVCLIFAGCGKGEKADTQPTQEAAQAPEETVPQEVIFVHRGVCFTLPGEFQDYTGQPIGEGYDFLFASAIIGITGNEIAKANVPAEVTNLEQYAAAQAAAHGVQAAQKDGIWTASYQDDTQNEPQSFVCAYYETEGCYWTVQSYCPSDIFEGNQEAMWGYVTAPEFQ